MASIRSKASVSLQTHVHKLINNISDMNEYLHQPIICDRCLVLPLGLMGEIMAAELLSESEMLAGKIKKINADNTHWEQVKLSSLLHRKTELLITLSALIEQLPAASLHVQETVNVLLQRITDRCRQIDETLVAYMSSAVVNTAA